MPIRIKDIANTASASSTLDFFAIDGNTNNTRKLSAFSPTFGGSLVVNGTLSTGGNATIGTGGNAILFLGTTGAAYTHYIRSATAGGAIQIKGDPTTGSRWLSLGRNDNLGAYVESININSNGLVSTVGDNETHISFVRNGTVTIGPDASATPALVVSSTLKINGTTNSTGATSGAIVVGNGTNGGIGVSGRSFFAEQVNVKALEATGTASAYNTTGGIGLVGASGSSYASIKAYTDAAGTEKTIALNPSAGAGVNIGGIGSVAGGSLLASGTVTASNFLLGSNGPSVAATLNSRAPRQGLVFDTTSNGATLSVPAIGTGDFTASAWVNANAYTASIFGQVTGVLDVLNTTTMRLYDSTGPTEYNITIPAIVTSKTYLFTWTRSGTTLTAYVNGVAAGTITCPVSLSAFNYLGSINGFNRLNGTISGAYIYNRALSAAEVLALYENGDPAYTDYNSASNTAINVASVVNGNQSGLYLYDTFTGASATGFTAIKTQTATEADVYGGEGYTVSAGQQMRVSFTCTATSGTLPVFYFSAFSNAPLYSLGAGYQVVAGVNTLIVPITANGTGVRLRFYSTPAQTVNYSISNLSVTRLGLLVAPDANQPGGGLAWYDTSGNNATITLPASGVTWNIPTSGYNTQTASVNGNIGFIGRNNSTGNAASLSLDLQNENGPGYSIGLRYFGNSFTQVNAYRANRGLLYGAFDINFLSGQYKFWFGGPGTGLDNSVAYEGVNIYGPAINTGTLTVQFTTPSSSFATGALVVGGGASFGGALFSQQNSNAIVNGLNAANTNAGNAATLRHTLTAGTNASTIEAYSNGHATFPGRLRFGTNNGQMDFVPSGVLGLSISASGVSIPNPLTVTGNITSTSARLISDRTASANGVVVEAIKADIGADATLGPLVVGIGGLTSATGASRYGYIGAGDAGSWRTFYLGANNATGGGRIFIPSTESSANTTSGALVVQGGVGIAGAIFAGGDIHSVGANASLTMWKDATPTKAAQLMFSALGDNGVGIRIYDGTAWSTAVNVGPLGTLTANAATNAFRIANSQTPASQTATGTTGQITWDSSYIYVCTATNNWGRSSLSWSGGGGGGGGSSNIWIPASEWIPRTTNGCGINSLESTTNRVNYDVLEFDPAAVEYAQAMVTLPNNWNAGTVTAKFHWTAASGSGDVVWQLSGRAYANDDAIDQATGTAQSSTDTLTAANDLDISPATSAITLAGTAANGNPVVFELSRNATAGGDTLAVDARLIGVEISYTI